MVNESIAAGGSLLVWVIVSLVIFALVVGIAQSLLEYSQQRLAKALADLVLDSIWLSASGIPQTLALPPSCVHYEIVIEGTQLIVYVGNFEYELPLPVVAEPARLLPGHRYLVEFVSGKVRFREVSDHG